MRLETEFKVGTPLDQAWPTLRDAGALATCIPGGELTAADEVYTGQIALGKNGSAAQWYTSLRAVDRDEDEHVATVLLRARQVDGPAIGAATITSRCTAAGNTTTVKLSADVVSSGYETSGEALERLGRELLEEMARKLEQRAAAAPTPPPRSAVMPPSSGAETQLAPVPSALAGAKRGLAVAGGTLLVIAVLRRLFGGRRGQRG